MTTATQAFIDQLTAQEQTSLLAGLRLRQRRQTIDQATLVGDLFESQLRILKRHADADQVRAIIRTLQGATA